MKKLCDMFDHFGMKPLNLKKIYLSPYKENFHIGTGKKIYQRYELGKDWRKGCYAMVWWHQGQNKYRITWDYVRFWDDPEEAKIELDKILEILNCVLLTEEQFEKLAILI